MSADHLTSPRAYRSIAPRLPFGPFPLAAAPTPSPLLNKSIGAKRERAAHLLNCNPVVMQEVQQTRRAAWAALDLRQDWADEGWLRAHLTTAKLRVTVSVEPATVLRLKAKLRSIGIHSPEVQEAVGMTLAGFLKSNPRLPLWVALAMVLEATGRFTPTASLGDAA